MHQPGTTWKFFMLKTQGDGQNLANQLMWFVNIHKYHQFHTVLSSSQFGVRFCTSDSLSNMHVSLSSYFHNFKILSSRFSHFLVSTTLGFHTKDGNWILSSGNVTAVTETSAADTSTSRSCGFNPGPMAPPKTVYECPLKN